MRGDPGRLGVCVCAHADREVVSGSVFLTGCECVCLGGFCVCTRQRGCVWLPDEL